MRRRRLGRVRCGIDGGVCAACATGRADACDGGTCACGSGAQCAAGQHCVAGMCVCNAASCASCLDGLCACMPGVTCPAGSGCCDSTHCTNVFPYCGAPGACTQCDTTKADRCANNACACGNNPACGPSETCTLCPAPITCRMVCQPTGGFCIGC